MSDQPSLFLSRLRLNPRNRVVQGALADCHTMHRVVMSGFPLIATASARETLGVLYRPEIDDRGAVITVLVQSAVEPDWAELPGGDGSGQPVLLNGAGPGIAVRRIDDAYDAIEAGARLRFRLRANPTKRVGNGGSTGETQVGVGKRVGLYKDADRRSWIEGKLRTAGCEPLGVELRPDHLSGPSQRGRKEDDTRGKAHRLTFEAVLFDGLVEVTDPVALRRAIAAGIGSGKAYGFGLLSLAGGHG